MAGGGLSGKLYFWEVSSWNLLATWAAHHKGITCLTFSDDDSLLISGAEDGIVCVWPLIRILDTMERPKASTHSVPNMFLYRWSGHRASVTSVVSGLGGANAIVVSSSLDQTCKVWGLGQGRLLQSFQLQSPINAIVLHPNEQALYAGTADGKISIRSVNSCPSSVLDVITNQNLSDFVAHRLSVTALAISNDGRSLVSGSEDSSVHVWDTRTGNMVRLLHARGPVTNVLLIPMAVIFGHCKDHEQSLCRGRTFPVTFAESIGTSTGPWGMHLHRDPVVLLPASFSRNGAPREGCSYSARSLENQLSELKHESTPAALELNIRIMKTKKAQALKTWREYAQQNESLSSLLEVLHSPAEKGS